MSAVFQIHNQDRIALNPVGDNVVANNELAPTLQRGCPPEFRLMRKQIHRAANPVHYTGRPFFAVPGGVFINGV